MIEYMAKKAWNQPDLSRQSGVSQTYISEILSGKKPNPGFHVLEKLAKAFNISIAELAGEAVSELAPIYIISYADAGSESHDYDDMGYPIWSDFDSIPRPADLKDVNAYALKVKGDSMEPTLKEGSIIIVSPQAEVHSSDVVVVRDFKNNVRVKRVHFMDGVVLFSSHNVKYEPLMYEREKIKFIHKVVQIRF